MRRAAPLLRGLRRGMATASPTSRPVYLVGQGMTPVIRKNPRTLREMGAEAIRDAVSEARIDPKDVGGLYVGNMLAGMLSCQQHIGPLLSQAAGLTGMPESVTAEACCGAGGAALRLGYTAVASGMHTTVVVAGVEAMVHADKGDVTKGLAAASDWEHEGSRGETFVTLNGHLMDLYLKAYPHVDREDFGAFSANAHSNAQTNMLATFQAGKPADPARYAESPVVMDSPIRVLDASPTCDGAAAVVLTSDPSVAAASGAGGLVRVAGSGAATDLLCVSDRAEPLALAAARASTERALAGAGMGLNNVDVFELHDAYTIMACLSLEASGFCLPGEGARIAKEGAIGLQGYVPIATFGGLKARGHPVGATGVYQAAEMLLQLTDRGGANQVRGAQVAMAQNVGGAGSSVFTHVFRREG